MVKRHFSEEGKSIWTDSFDEFKEWVIEETSNSLSNGKQVASFSSTANFTILRFKQSDESFFNNTNTPLQSHLFLYIDEANSIEEDIYWHYYCVFQEKSGHRNLVGFWTVYKSYQSITKYRMRISQFLILPPYQKQGLSLRLYNTVYDIFVAREKWYQITIESPTAVMGKIENLYILSKWRQAGLLDDLLQTDTSECKQINDASELLKTLEIDEAMKDSLQKAVKWDKIKIMRNYEFLILALIFNNKSLIKPFKEIIKQRFKSQFEYEIRPNIRFERLRKAKNRIRQPYIVFYDEDGEAECPPIVKNVTEKQEIDAAESKLEDLFTAFMGQFEKFGEPQKLLKRIL